jgi:alpha-mannosidase
MDLAFWPGGALKNKIPNRGGMPLPFQVVDGGVMLDTGALPPFSITPLHMVETVPASAPGRLDISPNCLENAYLRAEFNTDGDLVRLYDKRNQREVLPKGAVANQFQAFEDRPKDWDAWDVDIFYDDRVWLAEPADSIQVIENGPLHATLEIRRRILNSSYIQRISLNYNSAYLDFDTTIDWQERHILLKVAFPVEVLSAQATYEIQWGHVERPTHRNTSWDWARFETCAQKWIDLSEGGYGVSLLNDCKYGHDVHDNVMRISLLRGTTMPDPMADLGKHRFVYRLLPHSGGLGMVTMKTGYALNDPLLVFAPDRMQSAPEQVDTSLPRSLVTCESTNIIVETVKWAEDGRGFIVRLYEAQRKRGRVSMQTKFPLLAAWQTNLLEENQLELSVDGSRVEFNVNPFQIVTLRLICQG